MKVIITRPREDAVPLAEKLSARGHESRILPLLAIVPRADVVIPERPYQAVCITSANALAGLRNRALIQFPLLCVGPQSAAAAKRFGFADVRAEGGDVTGLTAFIAKALKPESGPLLYLSGAETSGDLEGRLRASGFEVDRIICYDAVPQDPAGLSDAVQWADAVLLYSPRSARLWVKSVQGSGVDASQLCHVCLSENVARHLPAFWARRIAASPDESAILASLEVKGEGH